MNRGRVLLLAVLVVLALVAGVVVWQLATRPDSTTDAVMADGTAVRVTAPAQAGQPQISAGPAADPTTLPAATALLSAVVHVSAQPFTGDATVTMSYDPAKLPPDVDLDTDLTVMSYFDEAGMWLPVESTVDRDAHTVSGLTDHFSDWVVAVTDPEQLRDERAAAERLNATLGGKLGAVLVGEQAELGCTSQRLLLPAEATPPPGAASKTCEDVLDDGSYRLQWVNTTQFPMVFDLPDGVEEDHADQHVDVVVQRAIDRTLGNKHPRGAVVLAGGRLDVRFKDPAISGTTLIKGDIDWPLAFLSMERGVVSAALLKGADTKAEETVDRAFDTADVIDCAATGGEKMRESQDRSQALTAGTAECAPVIAKSFAEVAEKASDQRKQPEPLRRFEKFAGWFGTLLGRFLSIPNLMKTARTWINTLIIAPYVTLGLDTSVTIRPTRLMSFAEAAQLRVASPDPGPVPGGPCQRLDGSPYLPPGMSDRSLCVQVVDTDLDGNGKRDRLLLWHPVLGVDDTSFAPGRIGAVAYLDDASYHLLDNPPRDWTGSFDEQNLFDYGTKLRLHGDRQEQIYVSVEGGANLDHGAILALGADKHLRAIGQSDARAPIVDVSRGGGAGYSASFGCVRSSGRNLFVEKGTGTTFGGPGGATYDWNLSYYSFDDRTLTLTGQYSGTSADDGSGRAERSTPGGSVTDCLTVDATEVGPVQITSGGLLPPGR